MSKIQDVIDELIQRKKSISCNGSSGLLLILSNLGFKFKDGKTTGHKIFTHYELSKISEFKTHSIDCGHKPGREMKFQYVQNTIRLLVQYKEELEAINEK